MFVRGVNLPPGQASRRCDTDESLCRIQSTFLDSNEGHVEPIYQTFHHGFRFGSPRAISPVQRG